MVNFKNRKTCSLVHLVVAKARSNSCIFAEMQIFVQIFSV